MSQPSAGITVDVIEVRVRSLVPTNCSTSLTNAATPERRSSGGHVLRRGSGLATHERTWDIVLPPSAAACSSAASTRRAWASQNSRSPEPPWEVAASRSVARSTATTGSVQPVSGSNVIVEPMSPSPTALNTYTGPRSARNGPQIVSRSVRVEVATAAPGKSSSIEAISPVLPVRGPPTIITTSSCEA